MDGWMDESRRRSVHQVYFLAVQSRRYNVRVYAIIKTREFVL
jgi:hypothetical protein